MPITCRTITSTSTIIFRTRRIHITAERPPEEDSMAAADIITVVTAAFGFKPGHSTVHQLARISEMVKRGFLAGKSTGMILLDVEKAYDSVWQDAVVYKLFRSNLQLFLVKIVESFLTNRSFTVTRVDLHQGISVQ
ncbi:hypothetical protein quinque_001536 [Culex quinquefasciatus]